MILISENLQNFIYYVGVYALLCYLYENLKSPFLIIKSILENFLIPESKKTLLERYGNWAVITGSTDGIGKEYSKELARQGINIVLISRSIDRLKNVAQEIESETNVKVKYIVADFTQGRELYDHIKYELRDIPVGILVNNVGMMHNEVEIEKARFENLSDKFTWDSIMVNVCAATMMTKMILPGMKHRGKGAIVNVSSLTHNSPLPFGLMYGATKSCIAKFTAGLQFELRNNKNITVQLLEPGGVRTKFIQNFAFLHDNPVASVNPKNFAKQAVFTLGKVSVSSGCIQHGYQIAAIKVLPDDLRGLVLYYFNQFLCK